MQPRQPLRGPSATRGPLATSLGSELSLHGTIDAPWLYASSKSPTMMEWQHDADNPDRKRLTRRPKRCQPGIHVPIVVFAHKKWHYTCDGHRLPMHHRTPQRTIAAHLPHPPLSLDCQHPCTRRQPAGNTFLPSASDRATYSAGHALSFS